MHLHHNDGRACAELPIRARAGEAMQANDGRRYDIAAIVAAITADPGAFVRAEVALDALAAQIRGSSKLTFHYVAAMSRADARRPLLLGQGDDGAMILLDGRHRAARSLQLGYHHASAWVLSPAQMAALATAAERPMSSVCS